MGAVALFNVPTTLLWLLLLQSVGSPWYTELRLYFSGISSDVSVDRIYPLSYFIYGPIKVVNLFFSGRAYVP